MAASRIVSIDVGGTFTDMLCVDEDGAISTFKFSSATPGNNRSVFDHSAYTARAGDELLYSTTATLNSLLAGDLPPIGLIVTAGFRELLETARLPASAGESAPSQLPRRLVALEWVREISARLDAGGQVQADVDRAQVERHATDYAAAGIEVVAVSLLHSYQNAVHERAVAQIFAEVAPHIEVIASCDVLPELREYERTLATALNACLVPVLSRHLESLRPKSGTAPTRTWLMQSSGGIAPAASIARRPLASVLSGPGAAVVGMRWLGEQSGFGDLITLDVGGTSTDVALIDNGRYALTTRGSVAGFPLKMPMLDVLSIGAGGGSIACEGLDKRWHVGPQSAAAVPGPACYGRGGEAPTLTDAQLVLGRLPEALLGGRVPLHRERADAALGAFGASRGFDALRTARGIVAIASHNMCGAIRRISVLRGHDPGRYTLLAMGGAGPLHAAELAELLGITTVLVPPQPGLAAALGLLVADVTAEFVAPLGLLGSEIDAFVVEQGFAALAAQAATWFESMAIPDSDRRLSRKLDLRYAGMGEETTIECPASDDMGQLVSATVALFHDYFERLSGRSWRDREAVEVVNLRLGAIARRAKPQLPRFDPVGGQAVSPKAIRAVGYLNRPELIDSPVYDRAAIVHGRPLAGPAIIEQFESTVVLPPAWQATVDRSGNLILRS